jgi:hypothetical protein
VVLTLLTVPNVPIFRCNYTMPWQAKPGCAEHHRTVIERMVNAFPPAWLLPPCTSEIFVSLEHCSRHLRAFSFAEGFDVVRKGGSTRLILRIDFSCCHYGDKTRNDRKLEDSVEYDEKGSITSDRQR